jgi:disulfide bond formation protein DsbB
MTIRSTYLLGFLAISILLLTSIYLQLFRGIIPCPLCSLQRLSFVLLGIWFLLGILIHAKHFGRVFINIMCSLTSILGMFLAGRQIWLQHIPSTNNTECGVSLQYMMQILPMNQVLQKIVEGSAECSQRGWEFLSLNMAEWALIWFAGFLLLSLYLLIKEVKNHKKK